MDMECRNLEGYEAIAECSGRMLGAAQSNDWDRLISEERRCRELIAGLQSAPVAALNESERARKHKIMLKMLADDAAIRNLADPWLRHLESVLSASGTTRKLDRSYGRQP